MWAYRECYAPVADLFCYGELTGFVSILLPVIGHQREGSGVVDGGFDVSLCEAGPNSFSVHPVWAKRYIAISSRLSSSEKQAFEVVQIGFQMCIVASPLFKPLRHLRQCRYTNRRLHFGHAEVQAEVGDVVV